MFTVRDVFGSVLTELNKKSAPSFSREDFQYFCNKQALFIANDGFQFYAVNGRISDDYRFLKTSESVDFANMSEIIKADGLSEYEFALSQRYFHMLSCNIYLNGNNSSGNSVVKQFPARRLTDDTEGAVIRNTFLDPRYNRPYYDINENRNPSNPDLATVLLKVGPMPNTISINSANVEYLTLPAEITVTDDDMYGTGADMSQVLEFPETLRNIYIGGVTTMLLEYTNNPRIGTLPPLSQDIPKVPLSLLNKTPNNIQQS